MDFFFLPCSDSVIPNTSRADALCLFQLCHVGSSHLRDIARKINMKLQCTFFKLSNTESYRKYPSVKAAFTAGVNISRKATHVLSFCSQKGWNVGNLQLSVPQLQAAG